MKKLFITSALLIATSCVFAQQTQKKLPPKATVTLTDIEIGNIYNKIDSVKRILINTSTLPANEVTSFNKRLDFMLVPLSKQLVLLMVADTVAKPNTVPTVHQGKKPAKQ